MSKKKNKKLRHISVRLTQDEHDQLTRCAQGRTLSDYVRGQVLNKTARAPLREVEIEAVHRLAQIGNTLSDYILHVATARSLKRDHVTTMLEGVESDLSTVRLLILRGEVGDGNR